MKIVLYVEPHLLTKTRLEEFKKNRTQNQSIRRFALALLFVLFGCVPMSFSQYSLSLGTNYVYSFGERTVNFQNDIYRLNKTQGYEITANNGYHFPNTDITATLEIGFRQLYFSGSSDNLTYSGVSNKLIGALGAKYSFSDKFALAAYIEAENNLELDDFNTGTGDLFRISLSLETSYFLTDRVGITFLLSRAMTPITEAYIISNPQYQARLGLVYQFIR